MGLEDKKEVKSQCKYKHSDTNTMKEKELEDQEVSQRIEEKAESTTKETTTEETTTEETTAITKEAEAAAATEWTAVWDANAQAYYWWNTVTNETTWNNPEYDTNAVPPSDNLLDSVSNTVDTQVRKELGDESISNTDNAAIPYSNYFLETPAYSSQAYFNTRTGRFTTQEDAARLNPDNFTIESRATKQMSYYFDVESYTEEYNRRRLQESGKKKPLTRKQVDYFKRMKKEKKQRRAREWLLQ